tara:strand:+ start:135 stop:659 length:525 start_codon:yes stop_codon:yes gene_type:complete
VRQETRRERYEKKFPSSQRFPIELATVNFHHDVNLAYLIRAAGCFGVSTINVIGSIPPRRVLNKLSGTMADYVKLRQFATPELFMEYMRRNNTNLVAVELDLDAVPIQEYEFNFESNVCIVAGHETTGIPASILFNSDIVYIPMPGIGYCLNTSQAANIILYEAVNQCREFLAR